MTDLQKILAAAAVSALLSGVGVFVSMRVEVAQLRERQANDYRELSRHLDLLRTDFQGVRGEIMAILKERR